MSEPITEADLAKWEKIPAGAANGPWTPREYQEAFDARAALPRLIAALREARAALQRAREAIAVKIDPATPLAEPRKPFIPPSMLENDDDALRAEVQANESRLAAVLALVAERERADRLMCTKAHPTQVAVNALLVEIRRAAEGGAK
mgnify:CR=1 FL=1